MFILQFQYEPHGIIARLIRRLGGIKREFSAPNELVKSEIRSGAFKRLDLYLMRIGGDALVRIFPIN